MSLVGSALKKCIKTVTLSPIITLTGYLLAIMPRINGASKDMFDKKYFAHRGLYDNDSDAPENSIKAFDRAVKAGYGIELDVQLTKDERVVVAHDYDLNRICGVDKRIRDLTYQELSEFTILGSEQHIPLFSDVLSLIDGRVPLIIEYKLPSFDTRLCEIVDRMLRFYKGDYCIESFHPMAVLWYRINRPTVIRGILASDYILGGYDDGTPHLIMSMSKNLLFNFIVRPDFIAYDCRYFTNPSRQICKKLYRATSVAWTIKSDDELRARRDDYDVFIFEGFVPKLGGN